MAHNCQKQIRLLHIVQDDKFFYPVKSRLDEERVLKNQYVVFEPKGKEFLRYIKNEDAICLTTKRDVLDYIKSSHCTFIMFHSLPVELWEVALQIPKEMKVIWWTWGYDIYTPSYNLPPFIKIELYKPQTKELFYKRHSQLLLYAKRLENFVKSIPYRKYRTRLVRRIDYFMPVICSEYKEFLEQPNFKAEEFYYNNSIVAPIDLVVNRNPKGDILCGNSATYTNNHFDLIPYLERGDISKRCIHIPLSYGIAAYATTIKKDFVVKGAEIDILDKLLPRDEYFKLLDNCTYFICGCIRQQAMGNIYYCLNHHIKLFLFRDSLISKFLKDSGYAIYDIEDIGSSSFITPLSVDEMNQNNEAYRKDYERRNGIYNEFVSRFS